jgi:Cu-Zn family superoxide dismutase
MRTSQLAAIGFALGLAGAGYAGESQNRSTTAAEDRKQNDAGRGHKGTVVAKADIEPKSDSSTSGKATFTEDGNGGLVLTIEVTDAPPGERAVHIHEKGDCSSPDGKSAGDHWNPTHTEHGKWGAPGDRHHLGDIGNMTVGPDGKGTVTLATTKWTAGTGAADDVIGKSIVVHGGTDDFTSQPAGNAGPRVGCGVITGESVHQ